MATVLIQCSSTSRDHVLHKFFEKKGGLPTETAGSDSDSYCLWEFKRSSVPIVFKFTMFPFNGMHWDRNLNQELELGNLHLNKPLQRTVILVYLGVNYEACHLL